MTNYSRGADFERALKREYEADGFFVVRSAGSRGAIDLMGIHPDGRTFALQAKLGTPTARERASIKDFKDHFAPSHCTVILATPKKREVIS